jgi:hypothetical protein
LLLEEASDILNAEEKWLEEIWDEIPVGEFRCHLNHLIRSNNLGGV